MFDLGVAYWFVLKFSNEKHVTIKGKVVEENSFMCKIERDDGTFEIIPFSRILDVNKARDTNENRQGL